MPSYKLTFGDRILTYPGWAGYVSMGDPSYSLFIDQTEHGTITADRMSGINGEIVTLGNIPDAGYQFGSYGITGAELTGNQFAFSGANVTAGGTFEEAVYTLTLQTDGHGTIAATQTTGHAGDTVTLSNTYNTYYRFNNYTQTGGTLNGSTFTFGNQDATAQANFKVNVFTASGGFEKGSNQTVTSYGSDGLKTATIGPKYAITSYHTSNVPTSYYATSNRWKPPTGISAYKISLNPKMTVTAKIEGGWDKTLFSKANFASVVGSTKSNTQSNTASGGNATSSYTWNYNKSFTSNTLNVNYSISGNIQAQGYYYYSQGRKYGANATYIANNTNGTWTATGYIP
jgi:hypothetical protein